MKIDGSTTTLPVQGNTMKACIPDSAPYLSHPLKMDNLPQICKHVSEYVLHGLMTTSASVILQI